MEENRINQIINSDEFSTISELSEVALDNFTDSGIIQDIPIIGTAVRLLNIGNTINDRIFVNKLLKFLKQLDSFTSDKILKETQYLDDSKKYSQKVGSKLLEIITRLDSEGKPEIVGRLYKSVLLKRIDYMTFLRLSNIVDKAFYYDLLSLIEYQPNRNLYIDVDEDLYNLGLVEQKGIGYWSPTEEETREYSKTKCVITDKGILLVECGLKS